MTISKYQNKTKVIFALALVTLAIMGCAKENQQQALSPEPAGSQNDLAQASGEMISSFTVSGFAKGGQKQWDLAGKSADIMSEVIKLTDVTGKVYGSDANMTIVADEGSLNRLDNNVHLEKNVLASTDDGATMRTDYLDWDAQNQILKSDAQVFIKRGVMEAEGTGFIAQPVLNLVELKNEVTVNLALEKQDNAIAAHIPTVITCDGPLEVDYQNNAAVFKDNVQAKDARGEIYADRVDVFFTTESSQSNQLAGMEGLGIEKIVALGNTEIHHGENITYSDQAVYDTKTGKLTLTGQPKLVIYSTENLSQLGAAEKGSQGKPE